MNLKNNAITLTELLVATVIVGIVMTGVTAVDFALRQSQQGTSRNSLLSMRTSAMMLHITKNAELATGDAGNPCIEADADDHLCIRQDYDSVTGAQNNSPADYSDDRYICYYRRNTDIHTETCNDAAMVACVIGTDQIIGNAINDPTGFEYTFTTDSATKSLYLEVQLISRYNPAQAVDIMDNPEYRLTARVSPASCSF